jgi:hypothetical protein
LTEQDKNVTFAGDDLTLGRLISLIERDSHQVPGIMKSVLPQAAYRSASPGLPGRQSTLINSLTSF